MTNYKEQAMTELLETNGAFFAFSDAQLEAEKVEGVEYASTGGSGLIAPKKNAQAVAEGIVNICKEAVKIDLRENTPQQISGDCEDVIKALHGSPFTTEEIKAEYSKYFQHCVENNLF